MNSISKDKVLITDTVKSFHCGQRFRVLAEKKGKASPTLWMKILNLNDKNSVYYRWSKEDIYSKELLLICNELDVSIQEFFQIPEELLPRPAHKRYIEDDIDAILLKLKKLEEQMIKYSK